jgi:sugar/nucleoside kinase (ribokinase family)
MSNFFVLGDLIIDHTVFVTEPLPHQQKEGEPIYRVLRRMDTAGGAANTARILAVLNPGQTFLWGLMGESNWGSFRSILENCQRIDGADSNVEFRGAQDETHAQMNTITRLFVVEGDPPDYDNLDYKARFDDYGHVHVPEGKRHAVKYYLERAHAKFPLDGIIINDYDMNGLTKDLVEDIATFANTQEDTPIPLFVDPQHDRSKYEGIEGTAILPDLLEWCYLVDEEDPQAAESKWRARLNNGRYLKEMAQLSFRFLGNFRYHIIKCGQWGTVVLAPHPKENHKYAVYRVRPHLPRKREPPPQLGTGDVLTAVFAMEFANSDQKTPHDALCAFQKANAAVACYHDMPWQHMPSEESVLSAQRKMIAPEMKAEPSVGMLFLPHDTTVRMSAHATRVPGLFSVDAVFRQKLDDLLDDIINGWDARSLMSIILGAPSGCGKSTLKRQLEGSLGARYEIKALDYSRPEKINWGNMDSFFQELAKSNSADGTRVLIMVDEALKRTKDTLGEKLKRYGVPMLNTAHAHNIRFLFIDALFKPGDRTTELTRRCNPHYLSGLDERPKDIPYIAAGRLFELSADENFTSIRIEGQFLLAITNAALANKSNPGDLCGWVDKAYTSAREQWDGQEPLTLRFKHLPRNRSWERLSENMVPEEYEFVRAR